MYTKYGQSPPSSFNLITVQFLLSTKFSLCAIVIWDDTNVLRRQFQLWRIDLKKSKPTLFLVLKGLRHCAVVLWDTIFELF